MTDIQKMQELAETIEQQRAEKNAIEKQLEENISTLIAMMQKRGINALPSGDKEFYISPTFSVAGETDVNPKLRSEFYDALRKNNCANIIKETINCQTLTSVIKKKRSANHGKIPQWLNIFIENSVIRESLTIRDHKLPK